MRIWPWSALRDAQSRMDNAEQQASALGVRLAEARSSTAIALAKLEVANRRAESLEHDVVVAERRVERLEADLAGVQADHRGLIAQMVGLAHGRTHAGALNLNPDPFAEESKQDDDWVQPEDADIDELTEMLKSQETDVLDGA